MFPIEQVNNDPHFLLRKAHAATSSIGSATVIVAMLERNGILKISSVGDCGLRVIREGQIIFSTSPQEHYFDCPYQLSSKVVGQTYLDAMVNNVELTEGDTTVMGSDGLFDNVFDHEIVSTIARCRDVVEAAKALANLASNHSMDSNFDSPYSLEARSKGFDVPIWRKILGMKLTGGKLDDITVVKELWSRHEAGMHIYARASAKGKRVQSNMGAKNNAIVMPDANEDATLNALVAAGFGAAGQRCMALSTVVFVGGLKSWQRNEYTN
ncbi:hypothetical protein CMV_026125 [Castanea mollissima]|uniref:Protein phosphatase n=1 Tax=Castanea mollissima TaxID=60419 RepID=A0A8J4QCU8_9ROSI|nr:hypothetical protein CMV_026125 [Castanea mollissima]